ncbi:MAG: hypothetical protein G3M78_13860 [Candidatus Nitrohelix vancouverensis]|uniref:Cytochrome c-552/4 domain-containing protein n=1 Tax=Candidatus Nitrohelix vancouverensis TaxID=2705534 RepID=A0A7T0C4H2_9BACT|nr:MAG: hypothetical protein G3M78_13860 [Candidatus Nitrohelix vancouverensis]
MPGFPALLAFITLCFTIACAKPPVQASTSGEFLLVYSGNTLGELKPCGCSGEEDQGGIEKRMTYLKKTRAENKHMVLVDTGDNFDAPTRQGKIKARYLIESMQAMNYDAVLTGDKDYLYGEKFLIDRGPLPWLGSNFKHDAIPFAPAKIKKFDNGIKLALLAVGDPELYYAAHSSQLHIGDPEEAVRSSVQALQKSEAPDIIVLMTHMTRDRALPFLDIDGVHIVVNGNIESAEDVIDMKAVRKDGKIFAQTSPRGQKMGEIRVQIGADGSLDFKHQMVPLASKFEFDPAMSELYARYNEEVEGLFFETMAARRDKNKNKRFASSKVCKNCHSEAYKTWKNSRHGHAYDTLVKVNKSFDPECLACHVVGLNQDGGFVSEIDTPELKNVQCENCHGDGAGHAQSPQAGFGRNANAACKNCHSSDHSPKFNFNAYWPKIKH